VIVVFDATTGAYASGTLANSTFDLDESARGLSLDPAADVLYIAALDVQGDNDGVTFRDALTGAALLPAPVLTGPYTWEIEVNPTLNLAYATSYGTSQTLNILDATTGDLLSSTAVNLADELVVNESAGILYGIQKFDDAVFYLDATDGSPLFGTFANSTFTTGDYPTGLALDSAANLLYVANAQGATVTVFDATTGAYAYGTFASSTFAAESSGRVAVDPIGARIYLGANGFSPGINHVTILDAATGVPANGTMANSTLDRTGHGPVVTNPSADRLYVVTGIDGGFNAGVTYYELSTGAFLNTDPPRATIPAGDAPAALVVMD
jgi:DNA-binding beta-propeller fold protein YncE